MIKLILSHLASIPKEFYYLFLGCFLGVVCTLYIKRCPEPQIIEVPTTAKEIEEKKKEEVKTILVELDSISKIYDKKIDNLSSALFELGIESAR